MTLQRDEYVFEKKIVTIQREPLFFLVQAEIADELFPQPGHGAFPSFVQRFEQKSPSDAPAMVPIRTPFPLVTLIALIEPIDTGSTNAMIPRALPHQAIDGAYGKRSCLSFRGWICWRFRKWRGRTRDRGLSVGCVGWSGRGSTGGTGIADLFVDFGWYM